MKQPRPAISKHHVPSAVPLSPRCLVARGEPRPGQETRSRQMTRANNKPTDAANARALAKAALYQAFDEGVIVCEFARAQHPRERVRVKLVDTQGRVLVDIRRWYKPRTSPDWWPGKGVALDIADLPDLITALTRAQVLAPYATTPEEVLK